MSNKLAWGIISTGHIAGTLAHGIGQSQTGRVAAVASRAREKAVAFGAKYDVPPAKCYGSYEELLADAEVQAVYIATPHPQHAEWAIKAAEAGKHVLVEKPMAMNRHEAEAIVEAAVKHGVFLMEAFMYRCHPQTRKLVELIKDKVIGDVRVVQATFSFGAKFDANSRLFKNELAGGGIMDVGCYPASMTRLVAGAAMGLDYAEPLELKGAGHLETTGVDGYASAIATFPGDIIGQLATGVSVTQESVCRVFGTEGSIFLPNPWVFERTGGDAGSLFVKRNGEKTATEIDIAATVTSFTMEVDLFAEAVASGAKQAPPPAMNWGDSLGNMALLDAWRKEVGVVYQSETPAGFAKVTAANRPLKKSIDAPMTYGTVPHLDKRVSRLVMGVDNQTTLGHAAAMFDGYFEVGGNAFDTAFVYASGVSERMLGHWIKSRGVRDDIVVICKGAHPPATTPAAIGKELAVSLDRLQLDACDLYMMHRDDPAIPIGEWVDALIEQQKAGRFRAFGGSNWSPARVQAANDYAAAKGVQGFSLTSNNFSLARMVEPAWAGCVSSSDPASRAWLTTSQLPLFPWSSQAHGFFTDRVKRDPTLNDPMINRCWVSDDNWQRRERAMDLANERGVLPINVALAYVLHQPFPTFPLIGPRTLAELRTSLPALGVTLSEHDVKWLNLEV